MEEQLVEVSDFVEDGSVDLHGHPVSRAQTGTWKASFLIIGVEITERFAYTGIRSNLVTYLTNALHESTATAATNVNIWSGVASMLPFLGAFVADSYLGCYWTILVASLAYLLGLVLVTLSASLWNLRSPLCTDALESCPRASHFKIGFFFFSIYLVALGQGGYKPCLQAFGADQFDEENPKEKKYKSSFFNWWYFCICIGTLAGVTVLMYIQDNVGWGLGFGIPAVSMTVALLVFLCGTRFYRRKLPSGSPLTQIIYAFIAALFKINAPIPCREPKKIGRLQEEEVLKRGLGRQLLQTDHFRFLDKEAVADELDLECKAKCNWRLRTVQQVEDVKLVMRMAPIWIACLTFGVVFSQSTTFFTKQGSTMDRKLGAHFEIPPASLQCFIDLAIMLLVPVYDRIFVPIARRLTGNERGITLLQRIGTGLFFSTISMIVAALIEIKRVKVAKDNGLVDMPHATIPLSIFWLLPQYMLFGIADVFTMIGMQEYFYDQMPDTMKSMGVAVSSSVIGIGSFLSSIYISVIQKLSCRSEQCWFTDNLNKGHLDDFYWFLAILSAINLGIFMSLASCYRYKNVEFVNKEECSRGSTLLIT